MCVGDFLTQISASFLRCHPREGGDPDREACVRNAASNFELALPLKLKWRAKCPVWVPAFAGMTAK
jgi:hypothetical protein